MMLAVRELNVDRLPESSRNWINEKLIYTHGYGVTMNPVNGFTPEGLPTLLREEHAGAEHGSGDHGHAAGDLLRRAHQHRRLRARRRQKEFNYPQGETNSMTSYEGTGGIVLGGFVPRLLIALDRGDLDEAAVQRRRHVRQPAADAAEHPRSRRSRSRDFLTFDPDPYIVVGDEGRLFWMMDAFTTSDTYPVRAATPPGQRAHQLRAQQRQGGRSTPTMARSTFYVFDQRRSDHRRLSHDLSRRSSRTHRRCRRRCASTCGIRSCCSSCRPPCTACTT